MPIIYNFYTVPDQMTVYDSTNPADFNPTGPYCIVEHRVINNPPQVGGGAQNTQNETTNTLAYPPGTTLVTIIMNQFGNPYCQRRRRLVVYAPGRRSPIMSI